MGELKPCLGRQFLRVGWGLATSDSAANITVFWLQGLLVVAGREQLGRWSCKGWLARNKTLHTLTGSSGVCLPPRHDSPRISIGVANENVVFGAKQA